MPQSIQIQHLNHVARPTKRLEESRRFYIDVLGFREISRPAFSFGGSWLFGGGIQIHLVEDLVTAPDPPDRINTRETHIAFAVPDVDAMEARLKEHGIPYTRSLIEDRQIHQVFFRDPDGHLIEFGKYGIIDR
jgi:catechol 2,3-dioxygenase-like lactoylglutathione lyase family enzyme